MEFSRPEYWCGQPFPSPGDLPNPGIKPRSPTLQADSLPAEPQGKPRGTEVDSKSEGFSSISAILFWARRRERVKACHRKGFRKPAFTMVGLLTPKEAK